MEIILNSNEHKINDNCLRYNFKQPIRFINQYQFNKYGIL